MNILANNEDADECVNDTYARAWSTIPPERPNRLSAFLGRITRNLALHVWEKHQAEKRGGGQFDVVLSELEELLPDGGLSVERQIEASSITGSLNRFLSEQTDINRRLFVHRYWHTDRVEEIAADLGISVSKAKSILFRMRKNLKIQLEQEGIIV
jgi:RNA polymerase sigma-70 factor (ECF subfamily)